MYSPATSTVGTASTMIMDCSDGDPPAAPPPLEQAARTPTGKATSREHASL
jgi:hypothetical protein